MQQSLLNGFGESIKLARLRRKFQDAKLMVQYPVSQWKTVANEFGVSKLEQDMMSKAFSKAFDR